jgi:hypothetical protein
MAVKIIDVKLTPQNYTWGDVKNLPNWSTFKNTNASWQQITQTTLINQPVKIEVEVVESDWKGIRRVYSSWQSIKDTFTSWLGIKNW